VDVSSQYQGNSLETLLALVAMDDGVTFVPKLAAIPREGIHYLPIFLISNVILYWPVESTTRIYLGLSS
jgi:DNA-binding transcriptional LysR family regulator